MFRIKEASHLFLLVEGSLQQSGLQWSATRML